MRELHYKHYCVYLVRAN